MADDGGRGPTLEGDDSEGADSGRLRGGTGGGTGTSSTPRLKLTIEDTDEDPEPNQNTELLLAGHSLPHAELCRTCHTGSNAFWVLAGFTGQSDGHSGDSDP